MFLKLTWQDADQTRDGCFMAKIGGQIRVWNPDGSHRYNTASLDIVGLA